jgi:hypothetical protein
MSKHTPAPWRLQLQRYGGYRIFKLLKDSPDDQGYSIIGDFRGACYVRDPDEETTANARLIAAAPELLAACKAVLATLEATDMEGRVLWIDPPHQLAGVHESAQERLQAVIEHAEDQP